MWDPDTAGTARARAMAMDPVLTIDLVTVTARAMDGSCPGPWPQPNKITSKSLQ